MLMPTLIAEICAFFETKFYWCVDLFGLLFIREQEPPEYQV